MKRLTIALILSLLFHISQYGLVLFIPAGPVSQINTPVEIEVLNLEPAQDTSKKEKQFVKTLENKNTITQDNPANFFAEQTNRVEKQTRAKEFGQFQNQENSPSRTQVKSSHQTDRPSFEDGPPSANPFSVAQNQAAATSRAEFDLPQDIQYGSATNLNTDAHMYASFYNRVSDLFYIRWAQRLDAIWNRLSTETKQKLSGRTWSTEVEILLDKTGKYQTGIIMKKSGFSDFDSAAIFGFQNAAFFPNPPKDKVESDGYIRLKYRISVQVRPYF